MKPMVENLDQKSERLHSEEMAETARLIATGIKTPLQIQEENSLWPLNTKFKRIDMVEYLLNRPSRIA